MMRFSSAFLDYRVNRAGRHTVSFVVTRSDHVRLHGRDRGELVIKLIQQLLVDLVAIGNSGVREEALDFLLEPVVGIGDITR